MCSWSALSQLRAISGFAICLDFEQPLLLPTVLLPESPGNSWKLVILFLYS